MTESPCPLLRVQNRDMVEGREEERVEGKKTGYVYRSKRTRDGEKKEETKV